MSVIIRSFIVGDLRFTAVISICLCYTETEVRYIKILYFHCSERCEQNMGLQDGRVRDDMLSASSYRDAAHASKHARIGGSQSWMPSTSDASPYIQVSAFTQTPNIFFLTVH